MQNLVYHSLKVTESILQLSKDLLSYNYGKKFYEKLKEFALILELNCLPYLKKKINF